MWILGLKRLSDSYSSIHIAAPFGASSVVLMVSAIIVFE